MVVDTNYNKALNAITSHYEKKTVGFSSLASGALTPSATQRVNSFRSAATDALAFYVKEDGESVVFCTLKAGTALVSAAESTLFCSDTNLLKAVLRNPDLVTTWRGRSAELLQDAATAAQTKQQPEAVHAIAAAAEFIKQSISDACAAAVAYARDPMQQLAASITSMRGSTGLQSVDPNVPQRKRDAAAMQSDVMFHDKQFCRNWIRAAVQGDLQSFRCNYGDRCRFHPCCTGGQLPPDVRSAAIKHFQTISGAPKRA